MANTIVVESPNSNTVVIELTETELVIVDEVINLITAPAVWGEVTGIIEMQEDLMDEFALKVDKVTGKGLSTNDFTDTLETKLNGIEEGAQVNVQADWNEEDEEADSFIKKKPTIPTALADLSDDSTHRTVTDTEKGAWNDKQDNLHFTPEDVANKVTTWTATPTDTHYPSEKLVKTDLDNKVDKVTGKGLSTNDFNDIYEAKLDGIEEGAQVNVQANWAEEVETEAGYIRNKPDLVNFSTESIQFDIDNNNPAHSEGLVFYDKTKKALSYYNEEDEVTVNLGQEVLIRVQNSTGVSIPNGAVVYPTGFSGGNVLIGLANASIKDKCRLIGVTTNEIRDGAIGYVTKLGEVGGLNTDTFSSGDIVYLSNSEDGALTKRKPVGSNYITRVGAVKVKSATVGSIIVDIATSEQTVESTQDVGFSGTDTAILSYADNVGGVINGCTLYLNANDVSYTFYQYGDKYSKTTDSILLPDEEGLFVIFYSEGTLTFVKNPTNAIVEIAIKNYPIVAYVYWNASAKKTEYCGYEMHGIGMSAITHAYLHFAFGARYLNGLAPNNVVADGDGDLAVAAQFGFDSGAISDEDIYLAYAGVASTVGLTIAYLAGTSTAPTLRTATNAGYSVLTAGTGRIAYNTLSGSNYVLSEVTNTNFVLCHIIAVNENNATKRLIAFVGQNQYTTLSNARAGATTEIAALRVVGILPQEAKAIATFVFETNNNFDNAVKARVRTISTGINYVDWRTTYLNGSNAGTSGGVGSTIFNDGLFQIIDDVDPTKVAMFQASGITTGTTRTITFPDRNLNLDTPEFSTINVSGADESTSPTTGALTVDHGVGVGGNMYIGGTINKGSLDTKPATLDESGVLGNIKIASDGLYLAKATNNWVYTPFGGAPLSSEMIPSFDSGNWTGTNGWSADGTSLIKVTNATAGTITPSGTFTVVAGRTYQVTIVCSAKGAAAITWTLGAIAGTAIVVGTIEDQITAVTTGKLIITGAINSTCTIDSITIKEQADNVGNYKFDGNIFLAGEIRNVSNLGGISIQPNGNSYVRGQLFTNSSLSITGALAGVTTLGTSGIITNSIASLTTTPSVGTTHICSTAALVGTPVRISPSSVWSGTAWNTTPTAASKINSMQQYLLPTSGAVTGSSMIWANSGVDGVANTNKLMELSNTGGLIVTGGSTQQSLLKGVANINNYAQSNIQNLSNGASASSDLVATADNGNETTNFVNVGINGSGYSSASWTISGALDTYLYASHHKLTVGTATADKDLVFHTGGTLLANTRMSISGTSGNIVTNCSNNYAPDTASTDTYTIAFTPAILAYVVGQEFTFKANTSNTGRETLNVNGLGAIVIVKGVDQRLEDNDILANMFCKVIYDGTNFVLLNPRTL